MNVVFVLPFVLFFVFCHCGICFVCVCLLFTWSSSCDPVRVMSLAGLCGTDIDHSHVCFLGCIICVRASHIWTVIVWSTVGHNVLLVVFSIVLNDRRLSKLGCQYSSRSICLCSMIADQLWRRMATCTLCIRNQWSQAQWWMTRLHFQRSTPSSSRTSPRCAVDVAHMYAHILSFLPHWNVGGGFSRRVTTAMHAHS